MNLIRFFKDLFSMSSTNIPEQPMIPKREPSLRWWPEPTGYFFSGPSTATCVVTYGKPNFIPTIEEPR